MKTTPGKMCLFMVVFVVLVHLIPATLYVSRQIGPWLAARPLLAQDLPKEDPQNRSRDPQDQPEIILQTIRGGRHKDYVSIAFQFTDKIPFDRPRVKGDEMHFVLRNVSTTLRPFRKYQTFDSWVRLEAAADGLSVCIGLPKGYVNALTFLMNDPHRLVVNIYDNADETPTEPRMSAPQLRISTASKKRPLIPPSRDGSIILHKTQFIDNETGQANVLENIPNGKSSEALAMDQEPGPGELGGGKNMAGSVTSPGMGSAGGGGVSSPAKRYRIRVTPKIAIKGEYDDNIFLYNDNKKGDFITTVSPGVLLNIDSGRTGLELEYTFGWVRYHDLSENDFVRHDGRLKFWQRLTRHLTFNLSDSYLKSNDLFDQGLPPDQRPQRIRHSAAPYQRNDFNASLDYRFGPQNRLSVGYRHGYLDNEDPYLQDVVEHSPYMKLAYWINKRDGVEFEYKYRRFDYTLEQAYGPGNVDLDAYDVDVAYIHRFARRSSIHARYGFANRNFKGIPVAYHVHDGSVGFEYGFSSSMLVALDIGYFSPTGIDIDPGLLFTGRFEKRFKRGRAYVAARSGWDEGFMDVEPRAFTRYWGADAGVEYEPVHDLQAYANVDYRKNDYALEEQEDDNTVGGRCGVRYRFLRWFSADLGYAHRRRISDDPNNEYGDNRITFTITAAKPQPYSWEF